MKDILGHASKPFMTASVDEGCTRVSGALHSARFGRNMTAYYTRGGACRQRRVAAITVSPLWQPRKRYFVPLTSSYANSSFHRTLYIKPPAMPDVQLAALPSIITRPLQLHAILVGRALIEAFTCDEPCSAYSLYGTARFGFDYIDVSIAKSKHRARRAIYMGIVVAQARSIHGPIIGTPFIAIAASAARRFTHAIARRGHA